LVLWDLAVFAALRADHAAVLHLERWNEEEGDLIGDVTFYEPADLGAFRAATVDCSSPSYRTNAGLVTEEKPHVVVRSTPKFSCMRSNRPTVTCLLMQMASSPEMLLAPGNCNDTLGERHSELGWLCRAITRPDDDPAILDPLEVIDGKRRSVPDLAER